MADADRQTATALQSSQAEPPAEPVETVEAPSELVESELLVEDVSIDGMCGVY